MTDHNYYYYYYFVDEKLTRKIYQIEKGRTKRRNWSNQKKKDRFKSNGSYYSPRNACKEEERKRIGN